VGFGAVEVGYVFFEGTSKQVNVVVGEDGVVFEVEYTPVPGNYGGVYEDALEVSGSVDGLVFVFSGYVQMVLLDYRISFVEWVCV